MQLTNVWNKLLSGRRQLPAAVAKGRHLLGGSVASCTRLRSTCCETQPLRRVTSGDLVIGHLLPWAVHDRHWPPWRTAPGALRGQLTAPMPRRRQASPSAWGRFAMLCQRLTAGGLVAASAAGAGCHTFLLLSPASHRGRPPVHTNGDPGGRPEGPRSQGGRHDFMHPQWHVKAAER